MIELWQDREDSALRGVCPGPGREAQMSTYALALLAPRKLAVIREKAADLITRYEGVGVPRVRLLGLAPGKTITDVWIAAELDNVGQLWGGEFATYQEAYVAARIWLKGQCVRCLGVRPAFGRLCHACADRILFVEEFDSYSHGLLADYVTEMREHLAAESLGKGRPRHDSHP